jgi:hypothetical protein
MATMTAKEKRILLGLGKFSEDVDWISKKQKALRKKFAGKYIAVNGYRVIDSDLNLEALLNKLRKQGEDPSQIPVEFISSEPPRLIL